MQMLAEDKLKLEEMERSVAKIEQNVTEIRQALLGNAISGEKGFKGLIETLTLNLEATKFDLEKVKEKVQLMKDEGIENRIYKQIITYLVGAIIVASIAFIFDLLKK